MLPRPPARLALSLAAAAFCDPPTSPTCVLSGEGLLQGFSCGVVRAQSSHSVSKHLSDALDYNRNLSFGTFFYQ